MSLSFYRCTPPCGGVPSPDLGQALRFRGSGVCCFLPSAGGLQRARVSSPGSVFDPLARRKLAGRGGGACVVELHCFTFFQSVYYVLIQKLFPPSFRSLQ